MNLIEFWKRKESELAIAKAEAQESYYSAIRQIDANGDLPVNIVTEVIAIGRRLDLTAEDAAQHVAAVLQHRKLKPLAATLVDREAALKVARRALSAFEDLAAKEQTDLAGRNRQIIAEACPGGTFQKGSMEYGQFLEKADQIRAQHREKRKPMKEAVDKAAADLQEARAAQAVIDSLATRFPKLFAE